MVGVGGQGVPEKGTCRSDLSVLCGGLQQLLPLTMGTKDWNAEGIQDCIS